MERIARIAAGVFVLAGGLVHLALWEAGYRGIPYVGPSFLGLAVVSAALAVALGAVHRRVRVVAAAGIAVSIAALAALVMSRTVGVFGFVEPTWSGDALEVLAAEIGAIVACAALAVAAERTRPVAVRVRAGEGRRVRHG